MEKHTIPDGPIPLYGLSPSAVSRQWGLLTLNNLGDVGAYDYCRFPIAFSNTKYSIVANHQGSNAVMAYQLVTEINSTYCVLCAKNYSGGKAVPWILNWIAIGC